MNLTNSQSILKAFTTSVAILLGASVVSCGGGSSDHGSSYNGDSSGTQSAVNHDITISGGVIPTFSSANTSTVFFVHNNSDRTIENIQYSILPKNDNSSVLYSLKSEVLSILGLDVDNQNIVINTEAPATCSTIAPQAMCAVNIEVPAGTPMGSNIVLAKYTEGKQSLEYKTVISYKNVAKTAESGLYSLGVSGIANWDGKDGAYETIYVYAGGGSVYTNLRASTNNDAYQVVGSTIANGQEIYPNSQVAAYEVRVSALRTSNGASSGSALKGALQSANNASSGKLMVSALGSNSLYSVDLDIASDPIDRPILIMGDISPIDTNVTSKIGKAAINIVNSGTQSATIKQNLDLLPGLKVVSQSPNDCANAGSIIAPGASCVVTVTNSAEGSSGSGSVSISYNDPNGDLQPTTSNSIYWYNSGNNPVVSVNITPNNLVFNATTIESTIVVIGNSGTSGFNLKNLQLDFNRAASSATVQPQTPSLVGCSLGSLVESLIPGGSCTYSVKFSDNTVITNGILQLKITGNYGSSSTYTRYSNINYSTLAHATNFQLTPSVLNIAVLGDNTSIITQVESLTNTGSAPGTVSSIVLSNNTIPSASLQIIQDGTNTCLGRQLVQNETCNFVVKLGPIKSNSLQNGTESITVNHVTTGQGASSNARIVESVNYTVYSNSQSATMESFTAAGSTGGTGYTPSSPLVFSGTTTSQPITLTYRNSGTNPLTVTGVINNGTNSSYWSSTNPVGTLVLPGESFNITYTNILAQTSQYLGGSGSSLQIDLPLPTLVLRDSAAGSTFKLTPNLPNGSNVIYAVESLIYITNTITAVGDTINYAQVYTNGAGYTQFNVTGIMEDYFTNAASPSITQNNMSCTSGVESAVAKVVCAIPGTSSSGNVSISYIPHGSYSGAILGVNWLTDSKNAVSLAPRAATVIIP